MNVRNCRKCGRLFNYVMGPPICTVCKDKTEEKFHEVKKYVGENPGVSMVDVSEVCEVEVPQIRQWIREERLQFSEDSPIKVECESCGAMIGCGRFCDKCKSSMAKEFGSAIKKPDAPRPASSVKKSKEQKMRFLDKD